MIHIIHAARDFLYLFTAIAVLNGISTIIPRPKRKKKN